MSKILVLLDASVYGPSVCDLAAWAARRTAISTELMHILGHRDGQADQDASGVIGLGARSSLLDELAELDAQRAKLAQQQGRALLEDAQERLSSAGVSDVSTVLRKGDLVQEIAAKELESELLIIGKRGEAADFALLHLGSNLERVVRTSVKPILVAAREFKPIQRALLAFDGSVTALQAVEMMIADPLLANLDLDLCQVGPINARAALTLEEAKAKLAEAGIDATTHQAEGPPDEAIASKVAELGVDLLIMGAYGHSRVRSLFIGSTTTEMIRSCQVPVLLVR